MATHPSGGCRQRCSEGDLGHQGLGKASEGVPWSWRQGVTPLRILNSVQDGLKGKELGRPCWNQSLLHPEEKLGINSPDSRGKIGDKQPRFQRLN